MIIEWKGGKKRVMYEIVEAAHALDLGWNVIYRAEDLDDLRSVAERAQKPGQKCVTRKVTIELVPSTQGRK